jgi:protein required for attachment to host cells
MTIWILVSDAGRGKLFSARRRDDEWTLVREFEHPEGRKPSREIDPSSPPGRMQESRGVGARRSAMEPTTSPKEVELERFAREIAGHLEASCGKDEFQSLVLVAPPHFLGVLHGTLGKSTARRLRTSIDKDLTMLIDEEIRERLLDEVFPM